MMKTSILFFPNEAKKSKRTAKLPLYMRICFMGRKAEARLNFEITQTELLKWDPFTMRLQERNSPVNHYLNRIEQKFQEFVILEATSLSEHSAGSIKDFVLGLNGKKQQTVMNFIDKYFEDAVLNNTNRVPGTIKGYRRSINHLRNFLTLR